MPAKTSLLPGMTLSILIILSFQNLLYLTSTATANQLTPSADASALIEPEPIELAGFRLISATEGWLLLDQRLYWTRNSGQSWTEITPANLGQSTIQAVWFEDAQSSWLVLTHLEASSSMTYILARTSDGGATWQISLLSLFDPGDPDALTGAIYLHFVDTQTGWLVVKRATSRNFSVGRLFKTEDGGQTWTELAIPSGEPVYFVTPGLGWTVGGPAGDQLYRSQDGGQTWQVQGVGQTGLNPIYQLPTFADERNGVLPVLVEEERVDFYLTTNGGETWIFATSVRLAQEITAGTVVPIEVVAPTHWLVFLPQSGQLLRLSGNNRAITPLGQRELLRGIVALDMATSSVGWARYNSGSCVTEPGQDGQAVIRCRQETRLLQTQDGGQTWTSLHLPGTSASGTRRDRIITQSVTVSGEKPVAGDLSGRALGGQTGIFIGQGFDKCEIASLSQLQAWLEHSPYRAVNLYIGGSSRYCSNAALSATLLAQLSQQGWQFIPTWVGPQAACTSYTSRMSSDLTTAYNQGIAEATAALDVAATLGLTLADKSGTVIYYDLEYFDTNNTACHDAAKAFISGWTSHLRAWGNQAGVYSTGPVLNGFAGIPNIPDAIWPAHWIYSAYNPNATVWNVYSLANSLWSTQQRIRQYTGGHNETWGGLTLNIDSDVIEGSVVSLRREKVYLPLIVREVEASPSSE